MKKLLLSVLVMLSMSTVASGYEQCTVKMENWKSGRVMMKRDVQGRRTHDKASAKESAIAQGKRTYRGANWKVGSVTCK